MSGVPRRIALMRAEADAAASAQRLAALGFEAALAPVFFARALQPAPVSGGVDFVLATSPRAIDLATSTLIDAIRAAPFFVVGETTRRAAERRGLMVAAVAPDALSLSGELGRAYPAPSRALYLAGVDRKQDLESALAAKGHEVAVLEVYAMRSRAKWRDDEASAVASCVGALHYSRRSAALAEEFAARAGILPQWRAMAHITISADAAEPLGGLRRIVAEAPNEAAMLEALLDALRH